MVDHSGERRNQPVSTRESDQAVAGAAVTLYRLYDESAELLYVGVTRAVSTRLHWHERHQPWAWKIDPSKTALETFPTAALASDAERAAIESEMPIHNIAGIERGYVPYNPRTKHTPIPVSAITSPHVSNLDRLRAWRIVMDDALAMRPAAIVHARDVQHREWNYIASAAGLSRQQVTNIYHATKSETA